MVTLVTYGGVLLLGFTVIVQATFGPEEAGNNQQYAKGKQYPGIIIACIAVTEKYKPAAQ